MSLHVVFAGINNKNKDADADRWGVGARHSGEGYAALYAAVEGSPGAVLLPVSLYGTGVLKGAFKVGGIDAGDKEFTKAVSEVYVAKVVELAGKANGMPIHFICHSGGGLPGLMTANRVVKYAKVPVATVLLVETPRTDEPGDSLSKVPGADVRRVAFFDGLKYKKAVGGLLKRFKPNAEFPGGHATGLANPDFLTYLRALNGLS